ncbi:MAG: hypothetical protein M0Z54_07625 [Thermaerobacter sp.]|nr:hypothetical protein [Thermaerobacter sp.]
MPDPWDSADSVIRQALTDEVAALHSTWFGAEADWDFTSGVLRRTQLAQQGRRLVWRWAASLGAVVLVGVGLMHIGASRSDAGTTALAATLAQDAGSMLNETIAPTSVRVSETGTGATLVNTGPGRWRTVLFRQQGDVWEPVSLSTVVAGISVTYQVGLGSTNAGVLLPSSAQVALEHRLAQLPYSPADSQMGALSRLPINLGAAVPLYATTPANQAKLLLQLGPARILALTYPVKTATGQEAYVPVGWYWLTGPPSIMQGSPSPAGSSGA